MFVVERYIYFLPFRGKIKYWIKMCVSGASVTSLVTGEIPSTFLHMQTVEVIENSPIDFTKINLCWNNEIEKREEERKGEEEMVCEMCARGGDRACRGERLFVLRVRRNKTRQDETRRNERRWDERRAQVRRVQGLLRARKGESSWHE